MSPKPQTYENHVRWYPLVHFVIFPIFAFNFLYQAVRLIQEPGIDRAVWVLVCLNFVLLAFAARLQAMKVQDRVIRLEERLRYMNVLPAETVDRTSALSIGQIIALRFASDAELPELVSAVCDGKISSNKEIKMAIKNWRGDHLRV
jgi:hypothetical protein